LSNNIQITFSDLQPEQQEVLIAHLAEAGFEGFVQGDTFGEENDKELKAFIPEQHYDKAILHELAFKYQLEYSEQIIPEQNWNISWESNFQPVKVDDFVAIRADFHEPVSGVEREIIITPKMSFGTGHHATTSLMVKQMREIDFTGKTVFDFGTGTGILSILSEKLGAKKIIAIDNDDWSIANAIENIERNGCRNIRLEKNDRLTGDEKYEVILANINKNVILENFSSLFGHLAPGGTMLLSGLLTTDEEDILPITDSFHLILSARMEQNNWICLRFKH
jgi:ribosomal protein L11 methyltransferase